MAKTDAKKSNTQTEQTPKKSPTKPKGRSFCCSMFIYTFVFVSGVVVATILPDLAGHHFKQPYGKEYGALAEQVVKDLPKHLNRLSETVVLFGQEVVNRAWDLKAEAERVIADLSKDKKTAPKAKTKTATQRPTTQTHSSN